MQLSISTLPPFNMGQLGFLSVVIHTDVSHIYSCVSRIQGLLCISHSPVVENIQGPVHTLQGKYSLNAMRCAGSIYVRLSITLYVVSRNK